MFELGKRKGRERVGDSGEEEREREWGIVGKKGREWGIVGKKVGKSGEEERGREWGIVGISRCLYGML